MFNSRNRNNNSRRNYVLGLITGACIAATLDAIAVVTMINRQAREEAETPTLKVRYDFTKEQPEKTVTVYDADGDIFEHASLIDLDEYTDEDECECDDICTEDCKEDCKEDCDDEYDHAYDLYCAV